MAYVFETTRYSEEASSMIRISSFVLAILLVPSLFAQNAALRGQVSDESGARIVRLHQAVLCRGCICVIPNPNQPSLG